MPEITDELFAAAVHAFYARRFPNGDHGAFVMLRLESELYAEDFRAALSVAFAAGQASATVGAKTQWGIRRTGFKTVRITSDTNARSLLRNFVVPAEMVMREVGPWEVVATNVSLLSTRES